MKFKAIKRIFCGILSAVMSLTLLPQIPVSAQTGATTYTFDGYKVEYSVMNEWDKNQNIGITITNTGTETIENWAIKYDASGEISNLWNGKINKKDGTSYIIENTGYNSDIKPNQTVNFGYQLTSEKPAVPSSYNFCMKRVPKTEGYTVTFSETGGYGSDVTGNITITNTMDKPIKAWELTFESDFTINNIWNAKLISSDKGKFVIKNAEDTSVIQPNSSVTFGLQCKKISEIKLNNEVLSEVVISDVADEPTEELVLFAYGEYNKETNSIVLIWESSVPKGNFDILTSSDGKDYSSVVQLNDVDTYNYVVDGTSEKIYFKIKETTSNNKTAESYPFIMAKTADGYELQLEDTDKDGLPDIYEEELGTDISKPDTDGDGITDYQEVYLTGTDPLKVDTDGNGINDGDEDTDKDGLSALNEITLVTDPSSTDTDNDGLNDGDEVNNYKTDPLKVDTDEDKMRDSLEIKYNTIPNNPDTDGNGILDGDEIYNVNQTYSDSSALVKPTITIGLRGEQIDSFEIQQISTDDILLGDSIPGYIGNAYDFSVNGTFDKAVLSFEFPSELLNDPTYVPAIYYYNEETGFLEELDNQTISANTVSAEIKHFSNYMVLNKTNFDKAWDVEILAPEDKEHNIDLSLVLDDSGSIGSANFSTIKNLSVDLLDKFDEKDRITVYTLNGGKIGNSTFTDKENAQKLISGINYRGGGTPLYEAITNANKDFISYSTSDKTKIMIVLTDGYANSNSLASSVKQTALNNNIVVNTIGLGSRIDINRLTDLATSTGGNYYNASDVSKLKEIFKKLKEKVNLYKDSDLDGISDYHEKKLASGEMRLGTGATLSSKFTPSMKNLDYMDPDSDKDDLIDGEELKIEKYITKSNKTIYYCKMNSHPLLEDSDGDGLLDGKVQEYNGKIIAPQDKKNPLKSDGPKGVWKKHIEQMKTATVPTELGDWYDINGNPFDMYIDDSYFKDLDITDSKSVYLFLKRTTDNEWSKALGSRALNFRMDTENIALHSQTREDIYDHIISVLVKRYNSKIPVYIMPLLYSPVIKNSILSETWQKVGGYNDFYDITFNYGTNGNMRREKFLCSENNKEYIVWTWRGDYLNCGEGAEIGVYTKSMIPKHWNCIDFTLPMTLNLYNYNGNNDIETVFNWAPDNSQWWITGFNPKFTDKIDVTKMVSLGTIDFSGHEDMYSTLKAKVETNPDLKDYLIFDKDGHTVWLIWYEKTLIS